MNPKQNPKQRKTLLDDGWPESVEEQGLLLLVLRHYITKRYIKKCIIGRREKLYQDNILHILQVQDTSLHRILLLVFHTRNRLHTDVLHTEVFTHRCFYTQRLLHTDVFTHRRFYTQKFLHTEGLHTDTFTHGSFYARILLHTDAFTHKHLYTQTFLHANTFTRKHFYIQTFLHADTFTHRRFYTDFFYTQKFLHGHFTLIRAKNVEEHVTLLFVTL